MIYVHEGEGLSIRSWALRYGPGDYLVLPIGTTWRLAPETGSAQRILYLEARRRSSRRSAIATTTASFLSIRPTRSATSTPRRGPARIDEGDFRIHVKLATGSRPTTTGTTRSTSSAGMATSGRSGSTSATSSRSPAASTSRRRCTRRPGPELRRVLVRAAQVRLPPARDPGAVQPLEHQQATRSSTTSLATS